MMKDNTSPETYPGITIFDESTDTLETTRFKVFQVIGKGMALAHCGEENKKYNDLSDNSDLHFFRGAIVLLIDNEKYYYDDEIINVQEGKQARHIGIFQYKTNSGETKTVPIVKIQ